MSAEATGDVWRNSPFSGAELLVHLAIADVVNDAHNNEFWMATGRLAEKAKVSRSTVVSTLRRLVDNGLLEVVESGKQTRTPTRYRFVTSAMAGHALARFGASTSAVSAHNTKRYQEPKGTSAVIGLADAGCFVCHGEGFARHPASGIEGPCDCTKPLAPTEERAS